MGKLAIVGGTSLVDSDIFSSLKADTVSTEYGDAQIFTSDKLVFIQRHGVTRNVPPHMINHKANLAAVKAAGADRLICLNSVGSLSKNIAPGTFVLPADFFSPWFIPTYHDDKCVHVAPGIDESLLCDLSDTITDCDFELYTGGTYIHALGPRFETAAEIRWMAQVAEVVGMTAGGEVPLANELDIPVAILAMVDNYANGIRGGVIVADVFSQVKKNQSMVELVLAKFIENHT